MNDNTVDDNAQVEILDSEVGGMQALAPAYEKMGVAPNEEDNELEVEENGERNEEQKSRKRNFFFSRRTRP